MKKIAKLNDVAFHLINKVNKKKIKDKYPSYKELGKNIWRESQQS